MTSRGLLRRRLGNLIWLALGVVGFLAGGAHAAAQVSSDINNAGPKPSSILGPILAELKKTMKDPYSIRDLRLCEPKVVPAFRYPGAGDRWEPAHWAVAFELNAKNGFGAYAGRRYFSATYQNGMLSEIGNPDLGASLNSKLLRITEDCPRVSDAQVQGALEADDPGTAATERG